MRGVRRTTKWLLAGLVLAAACSTDPEENPLVGAWSWVESTGGIAGVTLTPASTGQTMSLRFEADGMVELFRDGASAGTTTYTVEQGAGDGTIWTVTWASPLLGFETQTAHAPDADTLVLADGCCDGFTYTWTRS